MAKKRKTKNLKNRDLYKSIDRIPPVLKQEEVYPYDKKSYIRQCDDEKLIIDLSHTNRILAVVWSGTFVVSITALFHMELWNMVIKLFRDGDWGFSLMFVVLLLIMIILTLGFLLAALYYLLGSRNKKYVFDRRKGTLTYPALGGFGRKTQRFEEAIFIESYAGPYGGRGEPLLAILRPDGWTRSVINGVWVYKFFSLYVWYMDKNRSLPPGSAFDPYRERDFLRRQSENFPDPLYPSTMDITELPDHQVIIKRPHDIDLADMPWIYDEDEDYEYDPYSESSPAGDENRKREKGLNSQKI